MSVTEPALGSMVDKARGVARFASFFEVIRYLGLIGRPRIAGCELQTRPLPRPRRL
jgi:hypothetical protein